MHEKFFPSIVQAIKTLREGGVNLLMRCSHCGVCCEQTEMMLSNTDIKRLERLGHERQKFIHYDRYGFARLKNRHGLCIFYDAEKCRCQIYGYRPLGCRIYPVIYSEKEGLVVDDLCPMQDTVSKTELEREGKRLVELLQRIDNEAHAHTFEHVRKHAVT